MQRLFVRILINREVVRIGEGQRVGRDVAAEDFVYLLRSGCCKPVIIGKRL